MPGWDFSFIIWRYLTLLSGKCLPEGDESEYFLYRERIKFLSTGRQNGRRSDRILLHACLQSAKSDGLAWRDKVLSGRIEFKPMEIPPVTFEVGNSLRKLGEEVTMSDVAISVDGLKKSYGPIRAVDGLTFNVYGGEIYSLLGSNGAGKTTTVEILEGIRHPDSGKVTVLGQDPWHHASQLRNKVGIMPQDFRFMERITPKEAISYFCSLFNVPNKARELLKLVELEDSGDVRFVNLSGGQKQKVGICLALVNDPQVVFLDEPTTGLDPQARRKIWDLIIKLKAEQRTLT